MEHVYVLDGGGSYASVPGDGGGGGGGSGVLSSGGSGVVSGGSSILVGGSVQAERFSNSAASWERRNKRKARLAQRRIVPGTRRFQRGDSDGISPHERARRRLRMIQATQSIFQPSGLR